MRQIWNKLNSIKNLSRISYGPVDKYVKSLGKFVKPTPKPIVSEKNKQKRIAYCHSFRDFNFHKVLFSDESSFQLNANTLKVFMKKGDS